MLNKVINHKLIFICVAVVLGLLLARNPFGERTLIPNLEPYPDTIHYLTPARSLVSGGSLKIIREGRAINPGVPPLYSLFLAPFYLLNSDVRMFYISNVILSFISLTLFYLILRKVTDNKWVIGLALFLFVTNFFVYWYPQWAMAENLLTPVYFFGLMLLISKISTKNILLAGFTSIALYGIKYSSAPMVVVYWVFYLIKTIKESSKKIVLKRIGIYVAVSIVFSGILLAYISSINGTNPISSAVEVVRSYIVGSGSKNTSQWTSVSYVGVNLPQYLRALIGGGGRFLWDFTPIVPKWLGILGVLGLLYGSIFLKKTRFLFITMALLVLSEIAFMSTFYAFDIRYIYFAIPTLLLGLALFFDYFTKFRYFFILIALVSGYYLLGNALRIKNQIALNLRHAETPWHYIAVQNLNKYFIEEKDPKPFVISPEPPYYVDFYSNGNYKLLPISTDQEFRLNKTEAWGDEDYSDFHEMYKRHLLAGDSLYVASYGLGNESYLRKSFDELSNDFILTEVADGCYTQCKIYKLELKNAKGS